MANISFDLIIAAAGQGKRMGSDIPKPFIKLNGRDILEHSINTFSNVAISQIIIATDISRFEQIEAYEFFKLNPQISLRLCEGGEERHESVLNALKFVQSPFVAVHDAVRPFVSQKLIQILFDTVQKKGSAIPALKPRDTIKKVSEQLIQNTLDRNELILVQTPQFFSTGIYKAALQQIQVEKMYTDDSSIVESAGFNVYWIEGDRNNYKLTYPEDLSYAEWLLNKENKAND